MQRRMYGTTLEQILWLKMLKIHSLSMQMKRILIWLRTTMKVVLLMRLVGPVLIQRRMPSSTSRQVRRTLWCTIWTFSRRKMEMKTRPKSTSSFTIRKTSTTCKRMAVRFLLMMGAMCCRRASTGDCRTLLMPSMETLLIKRKRLMVFNRARGYQRTCKTSKVALGAQAWQKECLACTVARSEMANSRWRTFLSRTEIWATFR